MKNLLELNDKISIMIKEKIQESERFKNTIFACRNNCYIISNIEFSEKESIMYKKHLELLSEANIMKKSDGKDDNGNEEKFNLIDGSINTYTKKCQLCNGKYATINIAYYDKRIDIFAKYEDVCINLKKNEIKAIGIANELIMPELNNIIFIMNIQNENQTQR